MDVPVDPRLRSRPGHSQKMGLPPSDSRPRPQLRPPRQQRQQQQQQQPLIPAQGTLPPFMAPPPGSAFFLPPPVPLPPNAFTMPTPVTTPTSSFQARDPRKAANLPPAPFAYPPVAPPTIPWMPHPLPVPAGRPHLTHSPVIQSPPPLVPSPNQMSPFVPAPGHIPSPYPLLQGGVVPPGGFPRGGGVVPQDQSAVMKDPFVAEWLERVSQHRPGSSTAHHMKTVESLTLSRCTDVLSTAIAPDVVRVAVKLLEKGLISRDQLEEAQLQNRVSLQPEAFRVFLDALEECGVFEGVVREVYQQYAENQAVEKQQRTLDDTTERDVESNRHLPSVVSEGMNQLSVGQMRHLHLHVSNKCACSACLSVAALIVLVYVFPKFLQFFSTDSVYLDIRASPLFKLANLLLLLCILLTFLHCFNVYPLHSILPDDCVMTSVAFVKYFVLLYLLFYVVFLEPPDKPVRSYRLMFICIYLILIIVLCPMTGNCVCNK